MKKIILSLAVIGSFIFYSVHEKNEAKNAVQLMTNSVTRRPSAFKTSGMHTMMPGSYRDGTYTGSVEDVFYGDLQVSATIQGGKIIEILFLQYPDDRQTSLQINEAMIPILQEEAIQAQSAQVDIVSGATESSVGFKDSLSVALAQAR